MPLPKILSYNVFRLIGVTLVLLAGALLTYWISTGSGVYGWIAAALGNEQWHDLTDWALLLTLLIVLVPLLGLILLLRAFSQVPSFQEEFSRIPLWATLCKKSLPVAGTTAPVHTLQWLRIMAFVIDRSVTVVFLLLTVGGTVALRGFFRAPVWHLLLFAVAMVWLLIGVFYAYARDFLDGRSLGRRILGMRVVDMDTGRPIGAWRSFKREITLHFLPTLLVEVILLFNHPEGRRLGDLWAKSRVVSFPLILLLAGLSVVTPDEPHCY
jgi:uncharacterized RDD family membrane protein YckC